MVTAINDDLFSQKIVDDPYTYFSQIREYDPVHWNEKYELWLVSRYADLVWVARHPEVFSSEWWKRDSHQSHLQLYLNLKWRHTFAQRQAAQPLYARDHAPLRLPGSA